jgi:heat-inducible transcriptional repressor
MVIPGKEHRKFIVLGHIVNDYVSTATPVSSKTVVQRMGGNISSATIRNVMAELEHEGFIEQPHTSAGRIPTQLGYRYYVDMVTKSIRQEKEQSERLAREYTRRIRTIKEVIEKTTFLISRELHNAGIVMWPSIDNLYLKHLQLVKLRSETVLAVLITMTNAVKNHIITLDRDMNSSELERISNYINQYYGEESVSSISESLRQTLGNPSSKDRLDVREIAGTALEIMDGIMRENIGNDIYWEGIDSFMDEPEFRDISIVRRVLHMFSEKEVLVEVFRRDLPYGDIRVHIGEETGCDMLNDCSIVTGGYSYRGRTVGRLGVIGPTRMDYDRALRTVSCLSELISAKLEEIDE